jgi:hypothetical protein
VRAYGIFQAFGVLHKYLYRAESGLWNGGDAGGWEHFGSVAEESQSQAQKSHKRTGASMVSFAFWGVLNIVTLGVAIVVSFCRL